MALPIHLDNLAFFFELDTLLLIGRVESERTTTLQAWSRAGALQWEQHGLSRAEFGTRVVAETDDLIVFSGGLRLRRSDGGRLSGLEPKLDPDSVIYADGLLFGVGAGGVCAADFRSGRTRWCHQLAGSRYNDLHRRGSELWYVAEHHPELGPALCVVRAEDGLPVLAQPFPAQSYLLHATYGEETLLLEALYGVSAEDVHDLQLQPMQRQSTARDR